MSGRPLPGVPGFGCAKLGWLPSSSAEAVTSATARDAGLMRRALLGLSKTIQNPDPAISPQTRDRGGCGQRAPDHARGATMQQKPADCGTTVAGAIRGFS